MKEAERETPTRNPAMLTNAQREYLAGVRDYYGANERDLRRRIRYRVYNAMLDLDLLVRRMDLEQIDKAFETVPHETREPPEVPHAQEAITSFAALKYLIHRDLEQKGGKPDGWRIAMDVANGLEYALAERLGVDADIDVNIKIDRRQPLEDLAENTDDLTNLSLEQLERLFKRDYIDGEEYARTFNAITSDEGGQ